MSSISTGPGTITISLNGAGNFVYDGIVRTGPLTIANINPVSTLTANFDSQGNTISNTSNYIVLNSANITFDGQNIPVNVSATSYPGFLQKTNNSQNNVIVQNVNINVVGSGSMPVGGGWVLQSNTQNIIVNNCSSNGPIANYGGGIVGQSSQNIICNRCSSSGVIGTDNTGRAGGIIGANLQASVGISTVTSGAINCYSTGNILQRGGGIFGEAVNSNSRNAACYAIGCYSTGNILDFGGGIYGSIAQSNIAFSGSGGCSATNCYSLGLIGSVSASNAGGIYGTSALASSAFLNNGCIATNCYSVGSIGFNCGGIFGNFSGGTISSVKVTALKCYSFGALVGSGAGSFFGPTNNQPPVSSNCYGAQGVWVDSGATGAYASLDVAGNPNTWTSIAPNTPYILDYFKTYGYTAGPAPPSGYLYSFPTTQTPTLGIAGYYKNPLGNPSVFPSDGLIYGYLQVNTDSNNTIGTSSVNISVNGNFYTYNGSNFAPPLTIQSAGQPLTVNFNSLNNRNLIESNYMILNSNNITFNGQNTPVNISVANYPGFLRKTGTFTNIIVQNVVVSTISTGASLLSGRGWICGQTGWNGGFFINCTANGPVPANGGGIVGSSASEVNCINCYQNGSLGSGAGSVFGANAINSNAAQCFVSDDQILGSGETNTKYKNCYSLITTPQGIVAYDPVINN